MKIEKLSVGSHEEQDGACIMEYVSMLAKEPWSDRPACASASITSFCIWINDQGEQEHRDALLLLAPNVVGTRDFKKEAQRAAIFSDFALWSADQAAKSAQSAALSALSAESAEYAEYAEYAAEYAEYAAESAAESARYARHAKYAALSAQSAQSARYARHAAESAAESARYARHAKYAEYAEYRHALFNRAIETLEKVLAV